MNIDAQREALAANIASLIGNKADAYLEDSVNLYEILLKKLEDKDREYITNLELRVINTTSIDGNFSASDVCYHPEECVSEFLNESSLPVPTEKVRPSPEIKSRIIKREYDIDLETPIRRKLLKPELIYGRLKKESKLDYVLPKRAVRNKESRLNPVFELLEQAFGNITLDDLLHNSRVKIDLEQGIITPEIITLSMLNRDATLGIYDTLRDAYVVGEFFRGHQRIIDNDLDQEERQVFYILEEEGYVFTGREETILYDGREWRTHYWILNEEKILRNAIELYNNPERINREIRRIKRKQDKSHNFKENGDLSDEEFSDLYLEDLELWKSDKISKSNL